MVRIGVIVGSTRQGRNADKVINWLKPRLTHREAEFTILDVKEYNLPWFTGPGFGSGENVKDPKVAAWAEAVSRMDGFIVVTPEYNRSIPAPLKNAFDHLYSEWNKKAIAFVGYGTLGAARAVEHLRLMSIELQMAPIREQVAIDIWSTFNEKGEMLNDQQKHEKKIAELIDQLVWWAKVLKRGREER